LSKDHLRVFPRRIFRGIHPSTPESCEGPREGEGTGKREGRSAEATTRGGDREEEA
jgi:hypothetical protein